MIENPQESFNTPIQAVIEQANSIVTLVSEDTEGKYVTCRPDVRLLNDAIQTHGDAEEGSSEKIQDEQQIIELKEKLESQIREIDSKNS